MKAILGETFKRPIKHSGKCLLLFKRNSVFGNCSHDEEDEEKEEEDEDEDEKGKNAILVGFFMYGQKLNNQNKDIHS